MLWLAAAALIAGCAGQSALPKQQVPAAGALGGKAPLSAGPTQNGIVGDSYLYEQHERANRQAPRSGAATSSSVPPAPWSSDP